MSIGVREAPERLELIYLNDKVRLSTMIEDFFANARHIAALVKAKKYPELLFLITTHYEDAGDGSRTILGMSVVDDGSILDSLGFGDATVHQFSNMTKHFHYQRLGKIKSQE